MTNEKAERTWPARLFLALVSAAGFAVCLPLVAIAAWRILQIEPVRISVLADSAMPYLFLAAYVVFVIAIAARRKVLAVLASFLVVCHLMWMAPEMQGPESLSAATKASPSVTLFNQNIRYDNEEPRLVAEAMKSIDADIVFLQELSFDDLDAIESSGALERYPHRVLRPAQGAKGMGMLSKYSLQDVQVNPMRGFPSIRATTNINGYPLTLWSVHAHAPPVQSGTTEDWSEDLLYIKQRLHDEDGNVLVGGDFNATWSHRPYREIASKGYDDVHQQRGRGLARTWPMDGVIGPAMNGVIRIDHLLTKGSIQPISVEEEPGRGSDHRGLLARFALT